MKKLIVLAVVFLGISSGYSKDFSYLHSKSKSIPNNAMKHRDFLIRYCRVTWGINDCPSSLLAGQIHQESTWNPSARSKFAAGLSQFTPPTEAETLKKYRKFLDSSDKTVLNPITAIKLQSHYMKELYDYSSKRFDGKCSSMLAALSIYNGGFYIATNQVAAAKKNKENSRNYFVVEKEVYCLKSKLGKRSKSSCDENREYPLRITYGYQKLFHNNSFGGDVICIND